MVFPTSKSPRCQREGKKLCTIEEEDDRISILPDVILCEILSFLPTKDAVRTSSFSKRWSHVWMSVPSIEIDDSHLLQSLDDTNFDEHKLQRCFEDFVERVLEFNDVSCLRKFSLSFRQLYNYKMEQVGSWFRAAMMRDVVELDLGFCGFETFGKEQCLEFPCNVKNLMSLKLGRWGSIILNLPQSVHLPSLKILHIHCVSFVDENSMNNLIDGCPVLEELDLLMDDGPNRNTLFIRSASLKSLRLHTENLCDSDKRKIVVDAKNLERLDIKDDEAMLYDLNDLPSLVQVKLDHCHTCLVGEGKKIMKLLKKFSNTKYLFLSLEIMLSLKNTELNNPILFPNLTHLELNTLDYSWTLLHYLLECSPKLTTYVLHKRWSHWNRDPPPPQFRAPELFMILKLEEIEITGFNGRVDEMEMVKYFLNTAVVLKKFSIQSYFFCSKKPSETLMELLMFPICSTECKIIFNHNIFSSFCRIP